ncbi:MAG TPA: hypothetical protein VIK99_07780 [Thermaerobacter sp.]
MADTAIQAAAQARNSAAVIEKVVVEGDLSRLTPAERVAYYRRVCESLGLNPYTKPFDYIQLNGKLVLYARKDATEQLRKRDGISIQIVAREFLSNLGIYAVTARATAKDGRVDESIGAVHVAGLKGEALANALMKAETKAKRRVTLSICGLGWLDESEIADIPEARPVSVDHETGEIIDAPASQAPNEARTNGRAASGNGHLPAQAGRQTEQRRAPAAGDRPDGRHRSGQPEQPKANRATREQLRRIKELLNSLGWSDEDARAQAQARYGVSSATELTQEQAEDFARYLEDYLLNLPFDDFGGKTQGTGDEDPQVGFDFGGEGR